jgi:RNA polymerase sigma factor (TIGR02999 family)
MDRGNSLTRLLQQFCRGDRALAEELFGLIYKKLHQIARRELNREHDVAPLCPTELVGELWVGNLHDCCWEIESREHFFNIAGEAMRHRLIDCARYRLTEKRGRGLRPIPIHELSERNQPTAAEPEHVIEIGRLVEELMKVDPEAAHIIDLAYFSGLKFKEIAQLTGLSPRQVRRRSERGVAWLTGRLNPADASAVPVRQRAKTTQYLGVGGPGYSPKPS